AFIDSDAYPERDWLARGARYFDDARVGAVGGPNLDPPDMTFHQVVGGDVLYSRLSSRNFASRMYKVNRFGDCDELPSCNLIVRRAAFEAAGGFDPTLFVAEDSHLCAEIRRNGFRIHFVPDARVYHYRKPLFQPFLRQIWNAGWYRARLVRRRRSWDLLAY